MRKSRKLFHKLISVLLEWDGDEEILKVPKVLKWVYIFSYFSLFYCFFSLALHVIYPRGTQYEEIFTWFVRRVDLIFFVCILFVFFVLIIQNYRFLMIKGKHLKFANLLLYYLMGTYLFGKIYARLYILDQNLFTYLAPPALITNVVQGGLKTFLLEGDFTVYSFLTSLSANYYKISADSSLIAIVNILQLFFTFFVLSVLVALYSQRNIKVGNR